MDKTKLFIKITDNVKEAFFLWGETYCFVNFFPVLLWIRNWEITIMADCGYSAGSLTGAIIGTFVATLVLIGVIWFIYNRQKKRKLQSKLNFSIILKVL